MILAPAIMLMERPVAGPVAEPAARAVAGTADRTVDLRRPARGACIVCSSAAPQPDGCCSSLCAELAEMELQTTSPQLTDRAGDAGDRQRLAERAGRLSSALLRWHAARDGAR